MSRVRVLMLGGSVFAREKPDIAYLEAFAGVLQERLSMGERLLIVTGGGRPARHWIEAARHAGEDDEGLLDEIGIQATRLNAHLLKAVLHARLSPRVALEVPHSVEATAALLDEYQVAVMGGTLPGHSTDYVAATLASAAQADHLYILTNVGGVYTADPAVDPEAEHLPELTSSKLLELVGDPTWTAGRSGVVDPMAAMHVHQTRLPVTVIDGRDLDGLASDLAGRRATGTIVHPDFQQQA
jgi:uridylate kinase